MMKFKSILLLLLMTALCAGLLFAACGDDDDDDDDSVTTDDDDDDDTVDDDDDSVDDDYDDDTVFDPSFVEGKTYFLDIQLISWTEPIGVGDVIGYYVPNILLAVKDPAKGDAGFLGTVGTEDEPIEQNMCIETTEFSEGTIEETGAFDTGVQDFHMMINDVKANLWQGSLTGVFSADGSGFSQTVFEGMLDGRELEDFFIVDADQICVLAASFQITCEACPSDGEVYCVRIKAEGFEGLLMDDLTLEEVGPEDIGPECDDDDDVVDDDDDATE